MPCSFAKDLVSTLIRSSSSSRSAWAVKIALRVAVQNSSRDAVICWSYPLFAGAGNRWRQGTMAKSSLVGKNNQLYIVCQHYAINVNGNAAFRRSQAGSQCLCNRGISFTVVPCRARTSTNRHRRRIPDTARGRHQRLSLLLRPRPSFRNSRRNRPASLLRLQP